ncbi:protein OCTOPUS-like isoform X1 [Musa acuminata AAA Group]|uniref:protein OCTOPUS-like isoform X1 n=1 Tax=Musa acuminata AAA Group TaxID=214697 RepID=UPI0031D739C4
MALEIVAPPPFYLSVSTCDLHPDQTVTGFCASCLRERLASLDVTPGCLSTSSVSAFRSVFPRASASNPPSFLRPELRRCKSFSSARCASGFETERKSCDARGRYTLWSLFCEDELDRGHQPLAPSASASVEGGGTEAQFRNLWFAPSSSGAAPPLKTFGEEDDADEIRAADPVIHVGSSLEMDGGERLEETEVKPMKDHIDHEFQAKKPPHKDPKNIADSFWLAASGLSKKLQKWRRKHKDKKQGGIAAAVATPAEKPPKSSHRLRNTQSEAAVDAFSRRSCDTDPRFSLDTGRMSLDDPRFSLDESRASWDGYLTGGRSGFARLPPMFAVVEDATAAAILRPDSLIPVEEDAVAPGGSAQTRDYYLDSSSSRRRRSLDRSNSNSIREQPFEVKPVSIARVSPAGSAEFYHFHHANVLEDRELRDLSSKSLRNECFGRLDAPSGDLHEGSATKKPRKWSKAWNIWGLIQRRRSSTRGRADMVERSLSESWPTLRSHPGYNGRILQSNSSVGFRRSFSGSFGYGGVSRSSLESNRHSNKRREELVLERNRSARYSPNCVDNGMLRFYLTPVRNSRKHGGSGKGRVINSHYFIRNMLGLY